YRPKSNIPRFDRNHYIKAKEVRVIDDAGENLGILDTNKAISIAKDRELDLVLVNPNGKPPVAKITDWSKMKYDLSKKQNKSKKSGQSEIRVKPFIDTGDLNHKLKKIRELLDDGDKVKFTIQYKRGATNEVMYDLMNKVKAELEEDANFESGIKREG